MRTRGNEAQSAGADHVCPDSDAPLIREVIPQMVQKLKDAGCVLNEVTLSVEAFLEALEARLKSLSA